MQIKILNHGTENFIKSLDKFTVAKVLRTLDLLEKFGKKLSMPHSKKIDQKLFELRVRGTKEVRIIYCFYKNSIIILHGFIKKTQKIPKKVLNLARKRFNFIDEL